MANIHALYEVRRYAQEVERTCVRRFSKGNEYTPNSRTGRRSRENLPLEVLVIRPREVLGASVTFWAPYYLQTYSADSASSNGLAMVVN